MLDAVARLQIAVVERHLILRADRVDLQNCTRRWTGCWRAKRRSRRDSRSKGAKTIGLAVGKVIHHDKVGKHFELDIGARHFTFTRNPSGLLKKPRPSALAMANMGHCTYQLVDLRY
ncbi:MAG: hypothetical protein LBB76_11255 [Azoarcus sp.]|nr:hypothetical protein [Azoarcus sp.]